MQVMLYLLFSERRVLRRFTGGLLLIFLVPCEFCWSPVADAFDDLWYTLAEVSD